MKKLVAPILMNALFASLLAPLASAAEAPRRQSSLARLRPVHHNIVYMDLAEQRDRSLNEKLFNKEFSGRMRDKYNELLWAYEREARMQPTRRASRFEIERYESGRREMAKWTMKEMGEAQLKSLANSTRKGEIVDVLASSRSSSEETKAPKPDAGKKATAVKAAHRLDLPVQPVAEQEEEVIPTRLRAKLNILKTYGQVTFSNPVVITSVEAQAGENLSIEMRREFKQLALKSSVRYAVDESRMQIVMNKMITDEVSLDLNSERWGGSKRSPEGLKSKGTAKLMYTVSF